MATAGVNCPLCDSSKIVKLGLNNQQKQRYQCRNSDCPKNIFILDYQNKGCLPEIKQQIIDMTLNGSGIRDIARVLKISINTVLSTLKKRRNDRAG